MKVGDYLNAIATAFGVSPELLLAANPDIIDPGHVQTGQTILIPPPGWAPSPSPGRTSSPTPKPG